VRTQKAIEVEIDVLAVRDLTCPEPLSEEQRDLSLLDINHSGWLIPDKLASL
jgi:hypothetical protein